MKGAFTKKMWGVIGILVLGLIISSILAALTKPDFRSIILIGLGEASAYALVLVGIGLIFGLAALIHKLGVKKEKNVILVIDLGFFVLFCLYTLFSSFLYYPMVILLLIPILSYPTKKFLHITSVFYFISGFAIIAVQYGIENAFKWDIFILMIVFWLYALLPAFTLDEREKEKTNQQAQKTKLKFYKLKQSRLGIYVVLGIFLALEIFFVYAYGIPGPSQDIAGLLMLTMFFSALFIPSLVIIYRKLVDIEIDAKTIILIQKGTREKIDFNSIKSAKIKGEVGEGFSPLKEPVLEIIGKKNFIINLSNYSKKDFKILKDMLYTHLGEKFRDKKIV